MQRKTLVVILMLAFLVSMPFTVFAQDADKKEMKEKKEAYQFTPEITLKHTQVKSQDRTSTCWCWATISMLESEAMRMGKDSVELSEMFIVRHAYTAKADAYVRIHGDMAFPAGGAMHDVIDMMRVYGLATDEAYSGLQLGSEQHNHGEIHSVLNSIVDGVVKSRKPSIRWKEAYDAVADVYLGAPPEKFEYKGKEVTPQKFMKNLGIKPENYIEITAAAHKPLYEQVLIRLPDNWSFSDDYYNVKAEDLGRIAEYSIEKGYSVVFGGDIGSKHFRYVGVVPEDASVDLKKVEEPVKEKTVTAEMRQELFDNYVTSDDHAMHFVGLAKDQAGTTYFYTKNSWGTKGAWKGYQYMSKEYVNLNALSLLVNKNALPKILRKNWGFKKDE